jgi:hypothetical protein
VTADDETLRCKECGRLPRPDENAADEWRDYSDGVGELLVFCPECAAREFGDKADAELEVTDRRRRS